MSRRFISALALGAFVGCSDAGDVGAPASPNVSIGVDVSGDISLAPEDYRVSLDGLAWMNIHGRENIDLSVSPGHHVLSLSVFDNTVTPAWCSPVQPLSVDSHFDRNKVTRARFGVFCPPVQGS